jgi:hypothetical protein
MASAQDSTTHDENDAWHQFSEKTRKELLDDDAQAWFCLCGILFSIVATGVTGAGFVVYLISR